MIPAGLGAPRGVRPRHITAVFLITATGDAKLANFTTTNDGSFNRRLRDDFEQMTHGRWQPATLDGVAVPDTVQFTVDFP